MPLGLSSCAPRTLRRAADQRPAPAQQYLNRTPTAAILDVLASLEVPAAMARLLWCSALALLACGVPSVSASLGSPCSIDGECCSVGGPDQRSAARPSSRLVVPNIQSTLISSPRSTLRSPRCRTTRWAAAAVEAPRARAGCSASWVLAAPKALRAARVFARPLPGNTPPPGEPLTGGAAGCAPPAGGPLPARRPPLLLLLRRAPPRVQHAVLPPRPSARLARVQGARRGGARRVRRPAAAHRRRQGWAPPPCRCRRPGALPPRSGTPAVCPRQ